MTIDLNCDMGEGMDNDALIMPWISSANIACGGHAGDDDTMKRTIELALRHGVAIGAHPSFDDRDNFGRTAMKIGDEELYGLVTAQLHRIMKIAEALGAVVHHVKPHGTLYNMAAADAGMSRVIVRAIKDTNTELVLYGLSASQLIAEASKAGLRSAAEVFADRTYQTNGSLTPRSEANALIQDESQAMQQVLQMILDKKVTAVNGTAIAVNADTVCVHGDGWHAVAFVKKINETLKAKGIDVKTI